MKKNLSKVLAMALAAAMMLSACGNSAPAEPLQNHLHHPPLLQLLHPHQLLLLKKKKSKTWFWANCLPVSWKPSTSSTLSPHLTQKV